MRTKGFTIICCALLVVACHQNDPAPNEYAIFNCSPLEKSKIDHIISLGAIAPPDHSLPTPHIYFYFPRQSGTSVLPVYAPGNGVINEIRFSPVVNLQWKVNVQECKMWVKMNGNFIYHLDHIVPLSSLKKGSAIHAGQLIGTTVPLNFAFDLGVIDHNVTLNFANPKRYNDEILHCGKPLTYFADSLKAGLYSKVDREGADKDGQIDFDVPGRLVGNWFLDGSTLYTDGPDGWDNELSFAFDPQHPSKVMVSISSTLGLTGRWYIPNDARFPSDVSIANGKVAYKLLYTEALSQAGLMIVQMLDANHIKVEVFPNSQNADADFDTNAKVYAR